MENKNKLKKIDIKTFIIPCVIITLIFFIICYSAIDGIINYYYSHMREDSFNLAKTYSQSLSKSAETTDVINELLEEKLLVASEATSLYGEHNSNKVLKEIAKTLKVDEIYYYNSQGQIIHSNTGEFIGWKTYKYHPVHDLMNSDANSIVESIRLEKETGNYYKYGYFKDHHGNFVQIGVRADRINDFLGSFEMQHLLNEMKDVGGVVRISFIDNDLKIIGSTDNRNIERKITYKEIKDAIHKNENYSFINDDNGEREYRVFVPVYFEGNKIGTLSIDKSLKDTEIFASQVAIIGLVGILTIYCALLYIMISTYRKNKRLIQLAYYDTLTGLPNKQYLKEFLTEEIEKNKSKNKAVLLINFSDFKIVNLTLGFEYGDELLKELSKKINGLLDGNKKLFRFSDDRFILYVENYNCKKDLDSIKDEISQLFNSPIKVKDEQQHLSVKMGIVEINNKYNNFDKVLKDASISLNHIKDDNSINYAFFNEVMDNKIQREDLIEKELRSALSEENTKKLYLEFQPQIDLKTNEIVGFEALSRMKTESLGFISPFEFIDVAERKQLIIPLGNLILKTACNFINTIKKQGHNDVKVAVNVSGIQLMHKDFTDTVLNTIKENHIDESNLELEITESILLNNYDIVNERLKDLRKNNIEISLDDFGTGYSSFSRLGELNIDTVKIDRYFINRIPLKERKGLITGDIISMSHKLGLKVVAEGVELKEQKNFLIENHCNIMQGYLFSKPLSEEDAIKLLKINN